MNDIVFCAVLMASMASANAESWPVEGTVKAPCAVAVSLKSPLHFYATRGTPDALAKELRVRDAKGTEVPYAIRKRMIQFEPAPPDESNFNCAPVHDAKTKKTIFELDTRFIPVEKVRINASGENFSRGVRVMRRVQAQWRQVAEGRICAVNLPGEKSKSLTIPLNGECRAEAMRIEVDNMDNPPLSYEQLPISLFTVPQDIVFIASPGQTYSISLEKGLSAPRYDTKLLDYAIHAQAPTRLMMKFPEANADGTIGGKNGPTAIWLTSNVNPIHVASIVVFIILAAVCVRLFRSTRR